MNILDWAIWLGKKKHEETMSAKIISQLELFYPGMLRGSDKEKKLFAAWLNP